MRGWQWACRGDLGSRSVVASGPRVQCLLGVQPALWQGALVGGQRRGRSSLSGAAGVPWGCPVLGRRGRLQGGGDDSSGGTVAAGQVSRPVPALRPPLLPGQGPAGASPPAQTGGGGHREQAPNPRGRPPSPPPGPPRGGLRAAGGLGPDAEADRVETRGTCTAGRRLLSRCHSSSPRVPESPHSGQAPAQGWGLQQPANCVINTLSLRDPCVPR